MVVGVVVMINGRCVRTVVVVVVMGVVVVAGVDF